MRLSIIIPCFNEVQSIFEVFRRVEAAPLPDGWTKEIIIVDDGSDEATKRELARIGQGKSAPTIIYRTRNGGKGAAVKDGLRAASGAYVIVQDADLEYDPNDYMALLAPIVAGEASVVFGSRVLKDNNVPYNFAYFYGGLLVTKLFNFAFRTKLSDIATCYKVFPGKLIPQLVLSSHDDFVFDAVDLTLACIRSGPIREVPISYSARTKRSGKKLNWIHGIEIVFAIALARVGIPVTRRAGATKIVRFLVSGGAAAVVNFTTLFALTEFAHIWYLIS
jgi:dolichol-phosphate mannosyltransferase